MQAPGRRKAKPSLCWPLYVFFSDFVLAGLGGAVRLVFRIVGASLRGFAFRENTRPYAAAGHMRVKIKFRSGVAVLADDDCTAPDVFPIPEFRPIKERCPYDNRNLARFRLFQDMLPNTVTGAGKDGLNGRDEKPRSDGFAKERFGYSVHGVEAAAFRQARRGA